MVGVIQLIFCLCELCGRSISCDKDQFFCRQKKARKTKQNCLFVVFLCRFDYSIFPLGAGSLSGQIPSRDRFPLWAGSLLGQVPTWGRFPLGAGSLSGQVPSQGRFPLGAGSLLGQVPSQGNFPLGRVLSRADLSNNCNSHDVTFIVLHIMKVSKNTSLQKDRSIER